MKAVNLWKTLFCAALALTTFSACSDDDKDDDGGMPSITVNGEASTTVAVKLDGGTTDAIEVVSTGSWVLTLDDETATWCHPSKETGSKGKTTLTFTVDPWEGAASDAERSVTAKLLTNGSFEGIPIPKTATVIIKQNGDGSTAVVTNVKEIRTLLKAMNPGQTKVNVTDEIAAMTITGVVVSEFDGHNFGNDFNIAVQDSKVAEDSGLTLNGNKFQDLKLSAGTIVTIPLTGAQVNTYGGVIQLAINNDVAIETSTGTAPEPVVVSPDQFLSYESMLVKIENCIPATGTPGTAWNNSTNKGNANFTTTSGQAFVVRTGNSAAFKSELIPDKSGFLIGIAGQFNGDKQVSPRTKADLNGLDQPIPEPEYQEVTINNLGVGNYVVKNATIVGVHQKGVMFGQEVSGTVYYVLGFNNAWETQTANPYIADVDKLAEVKGASALRYGIYQFSNFDVTVGSASTLQLPAPADFDAAAIDAYISDPVYKYVKVVGVLDIDTSNPSYKTYTIKVADVTKTVAFAYGLDSYYDGLASGDVVEATGFALGYDTSNSKLNIMLRDIKKNTSVPAVTITTEPETFAATDPQQQTLAYTFANTTADAISFELDGTNADKFAIVSKTDANVVVKANGNNESDAAYTANLVAKVAGTTLASVELKQSAPVSGNGYAKIEKVADLKAGTGYLAGFAKEKYQTWTGVLSSSQCETVSYSYTESTGAFVADGNAAAEITIVAVDGVANAYYIKYGEKYLTVNAAGKNKLSLSDTAENNYWTFTDDTDGMKATAKAFESIMMTSTSASSKFIRSYATTTTTGVAGVVFFLAK
ncbi:MAG: DUF5689 domain-containing protein [Alistipes senegalensis]|nr:DUF5689 domain-containing protein [Alistipes senegalensis]